jgi:ABC-type transporter Mla subunit MlaD
MSNNIDDINDKLDELYKNQVKQMDILKRLLNNLKELAEAMRDAVK